MLQSPAPRILLARRRPRCCGGAGPQPSAPTRRPSEARPAGAACCSEAARRGHPQRERRGDPRGDPSARHPPAPPPPPLHEPRRCPPARPPSFPPGSRFVFIDPDVAFTSWMKGAGSARETPPRRRGSGTAACPRLRRALSWGGSVMPGCTPPGSQSPGFPRLPAFAASGPIEARTPGSPCPGRRFGPRLLPIFFNKIKSCWFL